MSQHWVPEDDAATGGRPRLDDDTEGHMHSFGTEPGARAAQDEDDTEGHKAGAEQPGVFAAGEEPSLKAQDDDTEGHKAAAEQPGVFAAGEEPSLKGQEDDTEGHMRFGAEPGMRAEQDEADPDDPGFMRS